MYFAGAFLLDLIVGDVYCRIETSGKLIDLFETKSVLLKVVLDKCESVMKIRCLQYFLTIRQLNNFRSLMRLSEPIVRNCFDI